jgi:hypothetical protein
MQTLLAIVLLYVMLYIADAVPEHAWIGTGIVLGGIVLFVAAWFALAFLVREFLKIALNLKD